MVDQTVNDEEFKARISVRCRGFTSIRLSPPPPRQPSTPHKNPTKAALPPGSGSRQVVVVIVAKRISYRLFLPSSLPGDLDLITQYFLSVPLFPSPSHWPRIKHASGNYEKNGTPNNAIVRISVHSTTTPFDVREPNRLVDLSCCNQVPDLKLIVRRAPIHTNV
uniref:Uncharacterized protein n=1 Tax=Timema cristinae TaxID=61476 RepID=A0A7R9CGR5_TIMCR|nr:unnamed protein product [Timema cristinae]